jgi:hypothetical protein
LFIALFDMRQVFQHAVTPLVPSIIFYLNRPSVSRVLAFTCR